MQPSLRFLLTNLVASTTWVIAYKQPTSTQLLVLLPKDLVLQGRDWQPNTKQDIGRLPQLQT